MLDEMTPRDYQPYVGGPFRWRLGMRPLDPTQWIEMDVHYDADVRRKGQLMATHPDTVNRALPGTEDEGAEVLHELIEHLCAMWPQRFAKGANGIRDLVRDENIAVDEHPLFTAGRLVQEDLALLVEREGTLVFGAGSVCFPNRWDLASKIGLELPDVHAPVAQLNEQLAAPIATVLERLTPDRGLWRLGWGLITSDDPYQPLDGTASALPVAPHLGDDSVADRIFLRVERETLRRFPRSNAVLFTIRTYIRPLRHLAHRPADATRLAQALANFPDDVREYKRTTEFTEAALHWLESSAQVAVGTHETKGGA